MNRIRGLTVVQIMLALLIAGIVARFVIKFIIEKRCESGQASLLCEQRKPVSAK